MRSASPAVDTVRSGPLERRSEERVRADWLVRARADPDAWFVLARGTAHLVRREPQTAVLFVPAAEARVANAEERDCLLLGWFRGHRCVLWDLPGEPAEELPTGQGADFEELRPLLGLLSEDEAGLLTYVRALLLWRARHRFCGRCGAPTRPRQAGHVLECTACGESSFPRIDPAIIVLVTDADQALLGRQRSWPAGRYSALAGFVEPGESLEQAVAREVEEETAVQVGSVRYFGSQPWPFPASLMLGFHARARAPAGTIRLDGELEDARWFDLQRLRAGQAALLPPPYTIARRLIEAWFAHASDCASPRA